MEKLKPLPIHILHHLELLNQCWTLPLTLDLVITSDDVQAQDLHVHPPGISDHSGVEMVLPALHTQSIHAIQIVKGAEISGIPRTEREIRRSKLNLDQLSLGQLSVSDLFELYANMLSKLLDNLLNLRKVKMRIRPVPPRTSRRLVEGQRADLV